MDHSNGGDNFVARALGICQKSGRNSCVDHSNGGDNFVGPDFPDFLKSPESPGTKLPQDVLHTDLPEPLDARPSITITANHPTTGRPDHHPIQPIDIRGLACNEETR